MSGARENGDDLCRETVEGWPKQKQRSCKGAKARGGEAAEGHEVVLCLEGLSHTGILAGEKVGEEEWIPAGGRVGRWDLIVPAMGNGLQARPHALERTLWWECRLDLRRLSPGGRLGSCDSSPGRKGSAKRAAEGARMETDQ